MASDTVEIRSRGAAWVWLLPAAIGVAWAAAPARFIAEDSYFYLVIARNLALHGEQTFSGLMPTNGAHPLWLYLLAAYDRLVAAVDPGLLYVAGSVVPLALSCLALGARNFMVVARRARLAPALAVGVPVVHLGATSVLGSEAHILYLALSFLALEIVGDGKAWRPRPVVSGIAAGAVFLARLDAVFVVAAFYVWYLARERRRRRVVGSALLCGAIGGAYVLSNVVAFGGAVPVSGSLKSTFPELSLSGLRWGAGLWPPAGALSGYSVVSGLAPLALALGVLVWRRRVAPGRDLLAVLAAGAAAHGLYVMLFTAGFTRWQWYYVVSVAAGAVALGLALRGVELQPRLGRLAGPAVLALGLALVVTKVAAGDERDRLSRATADYARGRDLQGAVLLVSEFPGRAAFHTGTHVIAADLLTANRRFYDAMVAAPNAFDYLQRYLEANGRHLEAVIVSKQTWLRVTPDKRRIEYFDPAARSPAGVIGRLWVGPPTRYERVGELDVWRGGFKPAR